MEQSQSTSPRSRFWLGVVLAFALLTLASCGALFAATGLSRVSLAELQGGGPAWTPPPVTPTPESVGLANASEAGGSDAGLFQPGQTVRNVTNSRVNVRATRRLSRQAGSRCTGPACPGYAGGHSGTGRAGRRADVVAGAAAQHRRFNAGRLGGRSHRQRRYHSG